MTKRFLMPVLLVCIALSVALVSACGGGNDGAGPDSGVPDSVVVPDAGAPDAGVADAGVADAGVPDAGVPDVGPPPPPPPPPPDAAVFRLYDSAAVHASLAASPIFYATFWEWENYRVWDGGGCLQASLDGSPPAPGTVLPTGSHTFAVTFDHCYVDYLVGTRLNGTASAAYTRNDLNDLTALVSVHSMRGTLANYQSDLYDVTADGSGTWTRVRTGGSVDNYFYTPTIGSTLVNNLTSNIATFTGGSYSSSYDSASGQQDFNNLAIAVSGTGYVLNGSMHTVYAYGTASSHTGEVRITSNGHLMARIYADGSRDLRIEVLSPLVPF